MNLYDALMLLNVDDLKDLTRHLPGATLVGRRAELANGIADVLLGPALPSLWQNLSDTHKAAVAEAAHHPIGEFLPSLFSAKYNTEPGFEEGKPVRGSAGKRSALGLYLYRMEMRSNPRLPGDLLQRLLEFVPEPTPVQLKSCSELEPDDDLVVRLTEHDALKDLSQMLRAIEHERVVVSDKTAQPGSATVRQLGAKLSNGDFYPWVEPKDKYDQQVGPIKAFAWPMLLQAAGLVKRTGTRLGLGPAGMKALGCAPAEVIRLIWGKWLNSGLLDEFSRIDAIKGQASPGRVMSAAAPRRLVIEEALQSCPVGQWVALDEFSRFMRASDLDFEVANDPWKLYICERQYGSLGYAGSHEWRILQKRYLMAFLFEYAATLGLIDVAYFDPTDPDLVPADYSDLWGTDELSFLSRYDGLCHFRITALGAFVLGLSATYQPHVPTSALQLRVMPGLALGVTSGSLDARAQALLDTWAVASPDGVWQLDAARALDALEKGHDIAELGQFLQNCSPSALPDAVASFIDQCRSNAKAVKPAGAAQLMLCQDAATAQRIVEHPAVQRLCWRVEARTLVVRSADINKFRSALRNMGLGLSQ